MNNFYQEFQEAIAEVSDLRRAAAVLEWDLETYMPPAGAETRSQQLSTLSRLAHERFTSDRMGELLRRAAETVDPASDQGAILRVTTEEHERSRRVPGRLVAEISEASTLGRKAWAQARAENHWSGFEPHLARLVELARAHAEALGYASEPFDAMLDLYEPGQTAATVATTLGELRDGLVPMVAAIARCGDAVDDSCLRGDYPEADQVAFAWEVAQRIGFDAEAGRQDLTAHPFCTGFGPGDVRITTRVDRRFLPMCLFGTIHEAGHGLYEQGYGHQWNRTPLWDAASHGLHESQSRLWENLVGRSRPFWRHLYPDLVARFPELRTTDLETFYRAINKVYPSFIRVEADEVTYHLHILIRFEIERELFSGSLAVAEVPAAWNARMEEYLGITPPDHAQGALQDVHWAMGAFGYFPSYTLGTLMSAMLMDTARKAMPDLDDQLQAGRFAPLLEWLRENVHVHGKRYRPAELIRMVTGREPEAGTWLAYARAKFGEIYGIAL